MTIFKCKMCGGALEIENGASVATCEYCGTQETLPKLDDDRRANLYDRANHFRRNNEFDKAMGIYENILNEDSTDAEAYWSLVLCRYGIEYVEDPTTHKRVPTVNRAQFTSIFDDDNYKSALQYADSYQRGIYESEAKAINEIQKGILAISQKEEPFDVFICYKETDSNGRRTPDSVLANDLYHQLTQEGFKVFFARITLEDKLGSAYEPYIFAALNSAKVMVVLGTKPEFFQAVWVRNEWSRYLALIRQGQKKMLIPAYKDMDPYDLPEEFSHLQAQDMGKLGFMQDLIRGIKKITQVDVPQATVVRETIVSDGTSNTAPLLKRAFMFLEDGDWDAADEYCEKVLDIEPECAEAYLGKLMAELKLRNRKALRDQESPFDGRSNYQKALRFAAQPLKAELTSTIEYIQTRNEQTRLQNIYQKAGSAMARNTESGYREAVGLFESISQYQDSAALAEECRKRAEVVRKDSILSAAKSKMLGQSTLGYTEALKLLKNIPGWKDADEKSAACQAEIEKIKAKEEAERIERNRKAEIARIEAERIAARNKKIALIATAAACVALAIIILLNTVIIPGIKYNNAIALMDAGQYEEAIDGFKALDGYKDSVNKINECNTAILDIEYNNAIALIDAGNTVEAYEAFIALDGYKDSSDKASSIYHKYTLEKLKVAKTGDYVFFGAYEQDNNTSNGKEYIEWLVLDIKDGKALLISKYALDCKQYNTSCTGITWETCSLRQWLNKDFINTAFSATEQAMIPTVTVSADKNPVYSTNPGNATQDKVFLLSITEANKYFSSASARACQPTAYAVANGAYKNSGNCWWWLRSPGRSQGTAAYVDSAGGVSVRGYVVNRSNFAVRPALWINLNS